ncbi:hypothetical protein [Granulicella tundricola]|uniref:Uncharacterized protein n=1 Tax=Granulicella tundricola (strain ATCC BAA-1859 / DSM 23138 / MP5ACTX9) TaxID=1198114 RepID=E8X111_GRATM|nr:hypothetical protein [Granulicella tundricola]ADW67877.1 hypothetical protein AciX9_0809 [Granulicella tundricola MP5ACTX9]
MTTKKIANVADHAKPKIKLKARLKTESQPASTSLYHGLNMVLHAVRSIAQYEDALCELAHEAKGSEALSAGANETLRGILAKIPSDEYLRELDVVRALVGSDPKAAPRKKVQVKKAGRASSK